MPTLAIAVLPGDGIGPETVAEALRVLDAAGSVFGFDLATERYAFGGAALDAGSTPLPDTTRAACTAADAVLKGPIGGARWDTGALRPEQGLLDLRAALGVYANLRPVRRLTGRVASPLRTDLADGIDLVIVRELTGGLYFGAKTLLDDYAADTCAYARFEVERITQRAFGLAQRRRGLVCSVDKHNVLASSKLWRRVVSDLAASNPHLVVTHQLVDSMAMRLVEEPDVFDVIVTDNMFGDILSDLAAAVAGGIGLAPSASLADHGPGLFEPVHGSAPDIAGRGLANPTATILSVAMMLGELGQPEAQAAIEAAVGRQLEHGPVTRDLGGTASCEGFGRAVADAVLDCEVIMR